MNYVKIYNDIIEKRRLNKLTNNVYGENHHIVPKSLGGGDNLDNLIKLTAKEHFICHLLLSEMFPKGSVEWYKMNHAFKMMCTCLNEKRYINSRLYELKKMDFSETMSWSQSGEKNSQYGKQRPKNVREKIKNSINKRLGKKDNLNVSQRKKNKKNEELSIYTYDGIFFGKQRRNVILKVFNIDLTSNFKIKIESLKTLLVKMYCVDMNSTTEMSLKLNADSETVRNYLKLFKIPTRNLSTSIKISTNKKKIKNFMDLQ
jgi:hypothetical protein